MKEVFERAPGTLDIVRRMLSVNVQGTIEMVKLDGATPDKSCRTTLHGGSNRGSLMEDLQAIAVDPTQQ